MSKIEIIRVEPLELPADIAWQITGLHHIALKDFYVYIQKTKDKMYVNKSVPEKDIAEFIKIVTSSERYILDDDTEEGKFMSYVYETYGFAAYSALSDYHKYKMQQKEEQWAKEKAKDISSLLDRMIMNEYPVVRYNESLIYEISKVGRKTKGKTPENKINYEDIYIFYLGYLVGAKKLDANDYSFNISGDILDYYGEISDMLEEIDSQEIPKIYEYLKEKYFLEENKA